LRSRFAGSTTRPPGLSRVPGALPPRTCSRRRTAPGPGRSWRLTNSATPSARGIRTRCAGSAGARSRSTPGTWPCRSARTHRRDGRRIRPLRIPRPQASRSNSATDQIRTLRSRLPVASRMPSGLNATAVTSRRGGPRAAAARWPCPGPGRGGCGRHRRQPAGCRPGWMPQPKPPRWTGCQSRSVFRDSGSGSLPGPSCRGGGQVGGLAGGVPAGVDPGGVEVGRGPGRGRAAACPANRDR
jgi:hypothetical protein